MNPILNLPNGETINLFSQGPEDMEYICMVGGRFKTPISELLMEYKSEPNPQRKLRIADEIRDQSYYFAGYLGDPDEELQQLIPFEELGEQIYQLLINRVNS